MLVRSELPTTVAPVAPISPKDGAPGELRQWIRNAARGMGLDGAPHPIAASDLGEALDEPGPYLILGVPAGSPELRGLPLVVGTDRRCAVIRPDGSEWRVGRDELGRAVREATTAETPMSRLFDGLPGGRAALAHLIEAEQVGAVGLTVIRYELDPTHPLASQLGRRGLRRLGAYLSVTGLQALVAVGAAWTLGNAALTGSIDLGRVIAWGTLALSDVPLQYVASTLLGALSLDVGAAVKKRLLEGALFIDEREVRRQGYGALLARLNEASVVEQTNVAELASIVAPIVQWVAALVLLARGVLPQALFPLVVGFAFGAVAIGAGLGRRYRAWYAARLGLTEDLVEKIVGHRTRTIQDNPVNTHATEDEWLHNYAQLSAKSDTSLAFSALFGRLWLLAAGVVIAAGFVRGAEVGALLRSAIGIFLAYRSFSALLGAASRLVTWLSAWRGVRSLFAAGRTRARPPRSSLETEGAGLDTIVSSLGFAYREGGRPILANANLRIKAGERLLIEGPSGGGKTTLSKLLTGELRASGGTILVEGVEFCSVSEEEWRRHVASSPQFHENYLFSNTFGFNVDPRATDGAMSPEALQVCRELGLEGLLDKMPAGAAQLLGETGWQLSHGERSRVFIARSLLQGARLLIFDESFGALDPETLALAIDCVRRRARTLVVIAHT